MKILYAASEAQPVAASGGLADVAGSLPKALVEEGHEACVVVPLYVNTIKQQWRDQMTYVTNFSVPVGWRNQYCGLFTAKINNVTYYFLDNEYYFKRDFGLYGYYDDAERYAFFSRAVLEMLKVIDFKPQIINSNDWQCALIPVYYSIFYRNDEKLWGIKNVFTIHNIQYQGRYGMEILEDVLGIPKHFASLMEYDRDINLMKAAIEVADKVTTVSPTYSKEILDPWFSHGLDRALSDKQYKTCGFLNGIDTDMYNPATDPSIPANFTVSKKAGKKICTQKLLEEVGLPQGDEPVLGMVSRLVEHKGFDLVKCVFDINNYALYFSRSKIPFERNAGMSKIYGHLGIYGYRKESLFKMTKLPQTNLEKAESLEQLRALQSGMRIKVAVTENIPVGIDTVEDLEHFKQLVER